MEMEQINKSLLEIQSLQDIREKKYYGWLKFVTSLSVGFLGIIVSFKPDRFYNIESFCFFMISISLIVIGILSSLYLLYEEIKISEKSVKWKKEKLSEKLEGTFKNDLEFISPGRFFNLIKAVCLLSYAISLVTIVLYVFFENLNTF